MKAPLLFLPVWLGGREVARRCAGRPGLAAWLAPIVAGAVIGIAASHVYLSVMDGRLVRRVVVLPFLPGFAGCLAGVRAAPSPRRGWIDEGACAET